MAPDEKLIDTALRAHIRLTKMFRYGGHAETYQQALKALAAWERLREEKQPQQLKL